MKRKYRGALQVVDLQDEVERTHALVPSHEPVRVAGRWTPSHTAWFDAIDARSVALRALWRASPKRAAALAARLGFDPPAQASDDDLKMSLRGSKFSHGDEPPCGKRLTVGRVRIDREFCRRQRGHHGECSQYQYM